MNQHEWNMLLELVHKKIVAGPHKDLHEVKSWMNIYTELNTAQYKDRKIDKSNSALSEKEEERASQGES